MKFKVYHWDTFDNETFLVKDGFTSLQEAEAFVEEHYMARLRADGADKVDIEDEAGKIVRQFSVG